MSIEANIVADSVSPAGKRITTLQLKYPRFIHSELMTHRAFSRNSMSSRAIPVMRMIEQVRSDPAMPVHWGKNQPGMQAREELEGDALHRTKAGWLVAANQAANVAEKLTEIGAAKQVANRILEPFQWMHTVVTATEWDNFFALRCHPDAQPEMQALAFAIRDAMVASTPNLLQLGEWHLPYVRNQRELLEELNVGVRALCHISAARCARVSYLKHDGNAPSFEEDLALFDRLAGSVPIHASPLEHQATPCVWGGYISRNFRGWFQFRESFEAQAEPVQEV